MDKLNAEIKKYEEMGQKWLRGEISVESWNCGCGNLEAHKAARGAGSCTGLWFNAKQAEFINSKERFCLISGGFASGKTSAFIVKLILLSLWFPGNRILLGRKSRQDVERNTLPDFIDICPPGIYEHKVGPGIIKFFNGSEIIFFGLDALQSGSGQDIKKAEQTIKGLNLGAFFIDQLEEIEQRIFEALDGRLRRNIGFQQGNATTNPANFWGYDFFKANPRPMTKLVETSMLDNKDHLPEGFIESQLSKPKLYVMRYVYGEWSPDSMVEGGVFPADYVKDQAFYIKKPLRELDGIKIFHEPQKHEYQIGIDPSEGSVDPCNITVVDLETGETAASYAAYVPMTVQKDKAVLLSNMYSLVRRPLLVPEGVGSGQALIELLKREDVRIYEREVFSKREGVTTEKLGFYTNYATKTQLIENMKGLFQAKFPKLRDAALVEELKTFIYNDEVRSRGAGAQKGYHDDRVMGMMLAYWNVKPASRKEGLLKRLLSGRQKTQTIHYQYN